MYVIKPINLQLFLCLFYDMFIGRSRYDNYSGDFTRLPTLACFYLKW